MMIVLIVQKRDLRYMPAMRQLPLSRQRRKQNSYKTDFYFYVSSTISTFFPTITKAYKPKTDESNWNAGGGGYYWGLLQT